MQKFLSLTGLSLTLLLTSCQSTKPAHSESNLAQVSLHSSPTLQLETSPQEPWNQSLEQEFQQRGQQAIQYYQNRAYGNTDGENEKRSYPFAMFDFLAGNRQKAINFLQSPDQQEQDNAHTLGIDFYYSFTLKGQIRKYFDFGKYLNPAYQQRMFQAAKIWTSQDPYQRPHPMYGKGNGQEGWAPKYRGGWVDGRNTDNLRAMRDTSIYLMAEETGNEEIRRLYQEKIQTYVYDLYHTGMGEWDSSIYLGHIIAPYLNLYDFAKNPEMKQTAKAALDWFFAAGALKYYRGGFAGPNKRDYSNANITHGGDSARFLWQYFGDNPLPNPQPERDVIHALMSRYRPPLAVVNLARKNFQKPVEILATKPIYEHWKPGGKEQPAYWETTYIGNTFQMGSVVSSFADGDVIPFRLVAENKERGVDFFVANTGKNQLRSSKNPGDQIAQYRNILIWLRQDGEQSFIFQIPKTVKSEVEKGIWFFKFEKTWLAVHPINLNRYQEIPIKNQKLNGIYAATERWLKATPIHNQSIGFALEVGEASSHDSYEQFKKAVLEKSQLNVHLGKAELKSSSQTSLKLIYKFQNDLPTVVRNGQNHDWFKQRQLYQPTSGNAPIRLGWKEGILRVEAGNSRFETKVSRPSSAKP